MIRFDNLLGNPDLYDAEIAALTGTNQEVGATFLGIPLCDSISVQQLCLQFFINLLVTLAIAWCFYYPKSRNKEFAVTFMLFGSAVFLLLFFMKSVGVDVSIGLGLFMIFGIMRYRTEMVPIREMTYLFISIAVAVINGINLMVSYAELALANGLLLGLLGAVEYGIMRKRKASKLVCYERIELIRPDRREELITDLENRLGHKVLRVDVGNVDFLRDVAFLKVHYIPSKNEIPMHEPTMKINEKNALNS
ncbi:MAG: DUF4956 domain-containing protein [Alistipes sp.]|nr:DUF4956 domain-containing protein [Alistipes sp.]